jgi:hypothetical protein
MELDDDHGDGGNQKMIFVLQLGKERKKTK